MKIMYATVCCCLTVAVGGAAALWATEPSSGPPTDAKMQTQSQTLEGQLVDLYSASGLVRPAGYSRVMAERKVPYFDAQDESASLSGPTSSPRIGEGEQGGGGLASHAVPYFDAQDESASLAGATSSPRLGEDMHGQGVAVSPQPYSDAHSSSASLTGETSSPQLGDDRIAAANGSSTIVYRMPKAALTLDIDRAQSKERLAAGMPAAIWANGHLYTLECDPKPLAPYAGETVRVVGTMDRTLTKVEPAKLEVKGASGYENVALAPPTTAPAPPSGTAIEK